MGFLLASLNTSAAIPQRSLEELFSSGVTKDKSPDFSLIPLALSIAIALILVFLLARKLNIISSRPKYVSSDDLANLGISSKSYKSSLTLSPDDSLYDAIELFSTESISSIPIISGEKVIGLISKSDVLKHISKSYDEKTSTPLSRVMSKKFRSLSQDSKLIELAKTLIDSPTPSVVIEDKNRFITLIDYPALITHLSKLKIDFDDSPILRQVMTKEFPSLPSSSTLEEVKSFMQKNSVEFVLIARAAEIVGILTLKDLINASFQSANFSKTRAETIMKTPLFTLTPGTSLSSALQIISQRKFNQIPLKVEGKIEGLATVKGILSFYLSNLKQ